MSSSIGGIGKKQKIKPDSVVFWTKREFATPSLMRESDQYEPLNIATVIVLVMNHNSKLPNLFHVKHPLAIGILSCV